MNDVESMVCFAAIIIVGVLLCMSGDYIRRKTGGRIRHAEIHLLVWIPTLTFEGAILFMPAARSGSFLLPLIIPAFVYPYSFLYQRTYPRTWRSSEERLDALDARKLQEQRRRERIESYKKGKRPNARE